MLNPNSRSLYTEAWTPPPGMVLDAAIATTFSLHPSLLLQAPMCLAGLAYPEDDLPDPVGSLKALNDLASKITVYAQRGRIQVPRDQGNPLFGLAERMVVEIMLSTPKGKQPQSDEHKEHAGVFHPKMWLMRFIPQGEAATQPHQHARYRLLVLSRNLTFDRSWDLSLQLEGVWKENGRKPQRAFNDALADFIRLLPSLSVHPFELERKQQAETMADALRDIDWAPPEHFNKGLTFHYCLPNDKASTWPSFIRGKADRMLIMSPFCGDRALETLIKKVENSQEDAVLVSRLEALEALKPETIKLFKQCWYLNDDFVGGDDEDEDEDEDGEHPANVKASGLHAKAYIYEKGNQTTVWMGSANATNAALVAQKNVELLVKLQGSTAQLGSIEPFFVVRDSNEQTQEHAQEHDLSAYLMPFDVSTEDEKNVDARQMAKEEAQKRLDVARDEVARMDLSIECRAETNEHTATQVSSKKWALTLHGWVPLSDAGVTVKAWPVTLSQPQLLPANDVKQAVQQTQWPSCDTEQVTGFIVFKLGTKVQYADTPDEHCAFMLTLPVDAMPEGRDDAITRASIKDEKAFLKYLMLIMAQQEGTHISDRILHDATQHARGSSGSQAVLLPGMLEHLTRMYCRHPDALCQIQSLMNNLQDGVDQEQVVPESFKKLWEVFQAALNKGEHA